MLYEKYIICEDGFGNVYDKNKNCIGFQLKIRLPYYRSVRLSLVDDIRIKVDGRLYPRNSISIKLDDDIFTLDEMLTLSEYYWKFGQIGTITVKCRRDFERMIGRDSNRIQVGVDLRVSYADFRVETEKMVRRTVNHG